eukprot:4842170-Pyramimonas_sp.AAC.2
MKPDIQLQGHSNFWGYTDINVLHALTGFNWKITKETSGCSIDAREPRPYTTTSCSDSLVPTCDWTVSQGFAGFRRVGCAHKGSLRVATVACCSVVVVVRHVACAGGGAVVSNGGHCEGRAGPSAPPRLHRLAGAGPTS